MLHYIMSFALMLMVLLCLFSLPVADAIHQIIVDTDSCCHSRHDYDKMTAAHCDCVDSGAPFLRRHECCYPYPKQLLKQ